MSDPQVIIIYDGECPVCTSYSRAIAIEKSIGALQSVNARDGGPLVEEVLALGFDLDEGFVVKLGESYFHGAEAIHQLASISGKNSVLNWLNFWVFKSPARAKLLYPVLKMGRNLLLAILGRSKFSQRG